MLGAREAVESEEEGGWDRDLWADATRIAEEEGVEKGVEFRMMEVIVLKLRGTISGVVSRFERLRTCRANEKKRGG